MKKLFIKSLIILLLISSSFLYSKKEEIYAEPFKIIFNYNGYGDTETRTPDEYSWVSLPYKEYCDDTKKFAFGGWYKDNDTFSELLTDSQAYYLLEDPLTDDLNVYAKWIPTVKVSGNVKSSGNNVENAYVYFNDITNPLKVNYYTQTDSDGNYCIDVPQNSSFDIIINGNPYLKVKDKIDTLETNISDKYFTLTRVLYNVMSSKNYTEITANEYIQNFHNDYGSTVTVKINDSDPSTVNQDEYLEKYDVYFVDSIIGDTIVLTKVSNLDEISSNNSINVGDKVFISNGDINIYDINDDCESFPCSSGYVFIADKNYSILLCETGGLWNKLNITDHVHDFNGAEPSFVWSDDYSKCTATLDCINASNPHTISETVESVKDIVTSANNFDNEFANFYAYFNNAHFNKSDYYDDTHLNNIEILNSNIVFKCLDSQPYVYNGKDPIVIKTTYAGYYNPSYKIDGEDLDDYENISYNTDPQHPTYYDFVLSTSFLDKLYYNNGQNYIFTITIDNENGGVQSIDVPIKIALTYKSADFGYMYNGKEIYFLDGEIKNGLGQECNAFAVSYSNDTYTLAINSSQPVDLETKDADAIRTHNGKNLKILGNGTININLDTTNEGDYERDYCVGIDCDGDLIIDGRVPNNLNSEPAVEYGLIININDKFCENLDPNIELITELDGITAQNGNININNAKIIGNLSGSFIGASGTLEINDSYLKHYIFANHKPNIDESGLEYPNEMITLACGAFEDSDMEVPAESGITINNSTIISKVNNEKPTTATLMFIGIMTTSSIDVENSELDFECKENENQMFALGGNMSLGIASIDFSFEEGGSTLSANFNNSTISLKNYYIGIISFLNELNFTNTDLYIDSVSSCIFSLGKVNIKYNDDKINHKFNLQAEKYGLNFDQDDPRNIKLPVIFAGIDLEAIFSGSEFTPDLENSIIFDLGNYSLATNTGNNFIGSNIPYYQKIFLKYNDPSINPSSNNSKHHVLDTLAN